MSGAAAERVREDRVLVLPEHRILFVPVPKSGCTSVKWHLAGLAGLTADRFASSRSQDVTRSMAIHDMELWDERFRWSSLTPDAQEAILCDDDWLRLAGVAAVVGVAVDAAAGRAAVRAPVRRGELVP